MLLHRPFWPRQACAWSCGASVLILAIGPLQANAQTFTRTDFAAFDGGYSLAWGISDDGTTVVGERRDSSSIVRAFRWTESSGAFQDLGTLGGTYTSALDVSPNGSVVVGLSATPGNAMQNAFRWTESSGIMQDLGTLGGIASTATGVSSDGTKVVGYSFTTNNNAIRAFRWTESDGIMQDLGTLGGNHSLARGVSADGSIIVGEAEDSSNTLRAFRWTAASATMHDLGTLGGRTSGATAVSADGTIVAGTSDVTGNTAVHAFRWTAASGIMQDLGTLGGTRSFANAISADGSTVVGSSEITGDTASHAFRWTKRRGTMEDLGGLGGTSSTATGVSADGSIVVGYSDTTSGETHAVVWREVAAPQEPPVQPPKPPEPPVLPPKPPKPPPPPVVLIDLNHTLAQINRTAHNTWLMLAQRSTVVRASLNSDCPNFASSNVCLAVVGRSTLGQDTSDLAGGLLASFRLASGLRLGAILDYPFAEDAPLGIMASTHTPRLGLFAAYGLDQTGFQARAAVFYHRDEVKLQRQGALAYTEAGLGDADLASFAAQAKVGYGFAVGGGWIATPFLGLSYAGARRDTYIETQGAPAFPFTYGAVSHWATTVEADLRLTGPLTSRITLLLGAGLEADLDHHLSRFEVASELPGLTAVGIRSDAALARVRGAGEIGISYAMAENQRLGGGVSVRGQAYESHPSVTVSLNYQVGF